MIVHDKPVSDVFAQVPDLDEAGALVGADRREVPTVDAEFHAVGPDGAGGIADMGEEELADAATVVCVVEVEFVEVDGPGVRPQGPGNEPDGLSCELGNHPAGPGMEGYLDDFRGVHPVEHEGDLLVRDHAPVTMPPDVLRQLTDHRDVIGAGDAQDGRREGRAFGGWNGVRHERGDHAVGLSGRRGRRKGERGGDVLVAVWDLSQGDEDIAAPKAFPKGAVKIHPK